MTSTQKSFKFLPLVTGLFTATLLISNTLDTKIFIVGPMTLTGGLILFPLAYIFGDILTEIYGYATSRKVIWTGFSSLILMSLCYELVRIIPPAPFWEFQQDYQNILGRIPRIVSASIVAYFVGEFTNSYVLAKMKVNQEGKKMGLRFIVSTTFGQAVDTIIFVCIAFLGTFGINELIVIFISGWLFKVAWEVVMLPITIPVVKWLKKVENEDFFDYKTNFNPFKFKQKQNL